MVWGSVAFAAGVWWLQQQATLPSPMIVVLLLPLWIAGRAWKTSEARGLRWTAIGARGAAWFLAGAMIATFQGRARLADSLAPEAEGRDIRVTGFVAGLPERTESGWRFAFESDGRQAGGHEVPRRTMITLPPSVDDPVNSVVAPVLPGEQVVFTARFRRPHGLANPHGFDAEGWLFERGIRATGYVRVEAPFQRGPELRHGISVTVDRWRLRIREHLLQALPDSPFAGVVVALVIGDQQAVAPEQWLVYTRTGVNHLMSISGLHITMLAGLAAAIVLQAWRRLPAAGLRWNAKDVAAWAGLGVALAYAAIAGFAVPAQRTVWMLAAVVLAGRLRIESSPWHALALALVVVLCADPMAVIAPGFWLSFGAVGLLVHGGLRGVEAERWFAQWTRTQWIMFVGLSPVVLAWFQEVSLIGPIANAFAVPVVSLAVVPLSLAGAVLPWEAPLQVAAGLLRHLHDALGWLSALPGATYVQAAPSAIASTFAVLGAAWILMPAGTPSRWLGALALMPLLLGRPAGPAHGEAWVTLLDVGQGLAVVVRTGRETVLFDTGPAWSAGADAGSRTVVPYLRGEGIRRLTAMVVSHDDRDHTGGAASVLRALPVDLVLTPLPRAHRALSGARRVMGCVAGQSWDWSGVRFEMLHPLEKDSVRPPARDNARSCVLRVTAGADSILLSADVERAGESAMVAAGEDLHADILVAPHHGSKTSSSEPFIDAVSPREVWFPVGYRNRFGHPHEDVVSRYRSRGVGLRRTDEAGALSVRLGAADDEVREWRREHRRYWHTRPAPNSLSSP